MSAARPLGRLLATTATTLRTPGLRAFSCSPLAQYPRRTKRMAPPPLTPQSAAYTPQEIEELQSHFSPEQLSALLAGENAIDRADFERRIGRRQGDPMALNYIDDLATLDPVIDFLPKPKLGEPLPRQIIPEIKDPVLKPTDDDPEGSVLKKLAARTGLPVSELKNLRTRLMVSHSVTNQTRMGKIRKIYALAVAGNGNGLLGIGEGKSVEHEDAIRQATYMAMRNMEPIPRYEGRTIYGDVEVKEGAVEMKVFTRPPGWF
jgi:small subunit ribosomal protein S5